MSRRPLGDVPGRRRDVPLDLVALTDVDALAATLRAHRERLSALAGAVTTLAGGAAPWEDLRARAAAALRVPVPDDPGREAEVVDGWGCPGCGRIDVPRECIGVCVARPVEMVDARRWRELEAAAARARAANTALSPVLALAAAVRPRPGAERATAAAMTARARSALDGPDLDGLV